MREELTAFYNYLGNRVIKVKWVGPRELIIMEWKSFKMHPEYGSISSFLRVK
jgi:hypothetical protein